MISSLLCQNLRLSANLLNPNSGVTGSYSSDRAEATFCTEERRIVGGAKLKKLMVTKADLVLYLDIILRWSSARVAIYAVVRSCAMLWYIYHIVPPACKLLTSGISTEFQCCWLSAVPPVKQHPQPESTCVRPSSSFPRLSCSIRCMACCSSSSFIEPEGLSASVSGSVVVMVYNRDMV